MAAQQAVDQAAGGNVAVEANEGLAVEAASGRVFDGCPRQLVAVDHAGRPGAFPREASGTERSAPSATAKIAA